MVPISTPDLKKVQAALKAKNAVIKRIEAGEAKPIIAETPNLYGDDVKMVNQRKLHPIMLTDNEKQEVVIKFRSGMTKTAIASIYGCHPSTIYRILCRMGEIKH